ncbi:MAG: preprotein translocase subunit YajC [Planctomycetia bacterium]
MPVLPSPHVTAVMLAQAVPGQPPEFVRTLVNTLPLALIVLTAYLLLFRPEREKQRRQGELLAGLKKNDRVVTSAGIYGTVANVDRDANRVTLKVDDAAKITVTLASIAAVLGADDAPRATRDEA